MGSLKNLPKINLKPRTYGNDKKNARRNPNMGRSRQNNGDVLH